MVRYWCGLWSPGSSTRLDVQDGSFSGLAIEAGCPFTAHRGIVNRSTCGFTFQHGCWAPSAREQPEKGAF